MKKIIGMIFVIITIILMVIFCNTALKRNTKSTASTKEYVLIEDLIEDPLPITNDEVVITGFKNDSKDTAILDFSDDEDEDEFVSLSKIFSRYSEEKSFYENFYDMISSQNPEFISEEALADENISSLLEERNFVFAVVKTKANINDYDEVNFYDAKAKELLDYWKNSSVYIEYTDELIVEYSNLNNGELEVITFCK
jgi:hypothetical protein